MMNCTKNTMLQLRSLQLQVGDSKRSNSSGVSTQTENTERLQRVGVKPSKGFWRLSSLAIFAMCIVLFAPTVGASSNTEEILSFLREMKKQPVDGVEALLWQRADDAITRPTGASLSAASARMTNPKAPSDFNEVRQWVNKLTPQHQEQLISNEDLKAHLQTKLSEYNTFLAERNLEEYIWERYNYFQMANFNGCRRRLPLKEIELWKKAYVDYIAQNQPSQGVSALSQLATQPTDIPRPPQDEVYKWVQKLTPTVRKEMFELTGELKEWIMGEQADIQKRVVLAQEYSRKRISERMSQGEAYIWIGAFEAYKKRLTYYNSKGNNNHARILCSGPPTWISGGYKGFYARKMHAWVSDHLSGDLLTFRNLIRHNPKLQNYTLILNERKRIETEEAKLDDTHPRNRLTRSASQQDVLRTASQEQNNRKDQIAQIAGVPERVEPRPLQRSKSFSGIGKEERQHDPNEFTKSEKNLLPLHYVQMETNEILERSQEFKEFTAFRMNFARILKTLNDLLQNYRDKPVNSRKDTDEEKELVYFVAIVMRMVQNMQGKLEEYTEKSEDENTDAVWFGVGKILLTIAHVAVKLIQFEVKHLDLKGAATAVTDVCDTEKFWALMGAITDLIPAIEDANEELIQDATDVLEKVSFGAQVLQGFSRMATHSKMKILDQCQTFRNIVDDSNTLLSMQNDFFRFTSIPNEIGDAMETFQVSFMKIGCQLRTPAFEGPRFKYLRELFIWKHCNETIMGDNIISYLKVLSDKYGEVSLTNQLLEQRIEKLEAASNGQPNVDNTEAPKDAAARAAEQSPAGSPAAPTNATPVSERRRLMQRLASMELKLSNEARCRSESA